MTIAWTVITGVVVFGAAVGTVFGSVIQVRDRLIGAFRPFVVEEPKYWVEGSPSKTCFSCVVRNRAMWELPLEQLVPVEFESHAYRYTGIDAVGTMLDNVADGKVTIPGGGFHEITGEFRLPPGRPVVYNRLALRAFSGLRWSRPSPMRRSPGRRAEAVGNGAFSGVRWSRPSPVRWSPEGLAEAVGNELMLFVDKHMPRLPARRISRGRASTISCTRHETMPHSGHAAAAG